MRVGDIGKATYFALLSRVPLLPVEYADSAYVVFMELLNHTVPPKNVTMLVGCWGKMEPLGDESSIADGWEQSIPSSLRDVEWRVAYKTTTFPCSSLNRDGKLLSTCGLVVASEPGQGSREVRLTFSSARMGPNPKPPFVKIESWCEDICCT